MFTLEELIQRWEAAKAAGEDHIKISRMELRDSYAWPMADTAELHGYSDKSFNDTQKVFEGIPLEVVD